MDRMIYVAMTGAKHTLGQHAAVSNNLANTNTTGYRAEISALRAVPVHRTAHRHTPTPPAMAAAILQTRAEAWVKHPKDAITNGAQSLFLILLLICLMD